MNPVRASLRHSQVTAAITAMLLALGIWALATMPRREDPKITIRTGIVAAFYPGAGAGEVENHVTRKIEERLFRFAEVRKERTFSTSRPGAVYINVELEDYVTDPDEFWSRLRLDLAQLRATELPEGVRGPVVDSDFGDTVAVLIAVHGGDYSWAQLEDYARRIEESLRGLRALARVRRIGERDQSIEITGSLERLAQYAVNPLRIAQALQGRNTVQYAGSVPAGRSEVRLRPSAPFSSEAAIRDVMIDMSPATGRPVYIGDLANVRRVYSDPSQFARVNGERAVLLAVEMQEGNNIVRFGDDVRATLERTRPLLPPDLRIDLVADQPRVVAERIRHFIREFGIAIAAVIAVTMLLLPMRVAVIAAIAIPVTVAVTFGLLNALGIELHQVSISALIVVLGMVVDDAIVIADNYVELLDRGVPREDAAWRSASEMAVPVLTATLTIIGSFLPMLILSGAVGEFIHALPVTVAIALGSSYVVAMLLTPLLARFFIRAGLHSGEAPARSRFSPLDLMQRAYHATIARAIRVPGLVVAAAVVAVALGGLLLRLAPQQFFPSAERNQFVIDIWMPPSTRIEATDETVRRIERHLAAQRLVAGRAAFIGASAPRFYYNVNPQQPAPYYAQILVNTTDEQRTPELIFRLRDELARLAPEALVQVRELQQGNVMEAPVEVRISGPDTADLRRLGDTVRQIFERIPRATYVHDDWRGDTWDLRVNVREPVANRLGLTHASIAAQLAGAFKGVPVTTFWEGDRDVPVLLRVEEQRRSDFRDVESTYVTSTLTGAHVPLRAVADLAPEWEPARIVHRNGVRTLTVRAFPVAGALGSDLLKAARPHIEALALPAGYSVAYGGELEHQQETFRELTHALAISVVAIYLILLFQFRSIVDPLLVMASIPLALPGASFGLFVTRNPFGFTAFLGIVSLGGVVVRNAIILIDYIRERIAEGTPLERAAVEAGERRLRPIFLTTMAAAVGVTPMILSGSSLWSPLASAIAFGLLFSMVFTLVVIPVLYVLVHRRSHRSAVALLCLAALPLSAQEARRVTLDEAVALAARNNAAVKIAAAKIREAEARLSGARANYLPQFTNQTDAIRLAETQRLDIPRGALGVYPTTGPVPGEAVPIALGNQNFLLSQTTLGQPLTQFFRIRAGTQVAAADVDDARALASRAAAEVRLRTTEAFWGLLSAARRRAALALQIEAGEARLKEAADAVEAGAALELTVLEGRARLAEARHGLLTVDDTVADLRMELNSLLGLPLDTALELVPPAPQAAAPRAPEPLDDNPEVRSAAAAVRKADAGVRAARTAYIPDASAFVRHIYQSGVPLLARNNAAYGVNLNVDIFDFGRRRAVVREREAQLDQARENLARVRDRARIDLEKALRREARQEALVASAAAAVAARREARRVTADQVEAETVTAAPLREADARLLAAEADLFAAEGNRTVAAAEVERITGR